MQVPGAMPEWFMVAGFHDAVLWHESHAEAVGICEPGLPAAVEPL